MLRVVRGPSSLWRPSASPRRAGVSGGSAGTRSARPTASATHRSGEHEPAGVGRARDAQQRGSDKEDRACLSPSSAISDLDGRRVTSSAAHASPRRSVTRVELAYSQIDADGSQGPDQRGPRRMRLVRSLRHGDQFASCQGRSSGLRFPPTSFAGRATVGGTASTWSPAAM